MLQDIWRSFRSIPLWVQIWMYFLVAVNVFTLAFLGEYNAGLIATLSIAGMFPNVLLALYQRGVSKAWAFPHIFVWSLQVPIIAYYLVVSGPTSQTYNIFLIVLLVTNSISLIFDYIDGFKWLLGDRDISRPKETE